MIPTKYAAFLRGIGPGDPKKSNESLRNVFESLGYSNVRSFISSGNILFESPNKNIEQLEQEIEEALLKSIGKPCYTIVKSKEELEEFLTTKPFGSLKHDATSYLIVTFFRKIPKTLDIKNSLTFAQKIKALCTIIDTTASGTPEFMLHLEKNYGKAITTRTINTLERIAKRL